MLPNFMVIGAPRAGTTSLYHYLAQHPDVYMSPVKETNYYWYEGQASGRKSIKTRAEYEALFDGVTTETRVGEASPQYLNSTTAPDRILRDLPDVRLIASLRHPVERAYSGYLCWLRNGRGTTPVRQALRPGMEFFEHGLYAARLTRYFERFPRTSIKIVLFDDFATNPAGTVQDLFAFLGVDPSFLPDTRVAHNGTRMPASPRLNVLFSRLSSARRAIGRWVPLLAGSTGLLNPVHKKNVAPAPPLPPDLYAELVERFADDILRTGALIGRDLSGWLTARQ